MAWDYFFQSDTTYFYADIYGPFQVGSRYLIGGPIVIRSRDMYCAFEAAHDAVGDAALLYGLIKSRGAVWATNGNAVRIRDLLGGFSNDYTGGFTVGAAVDFIVGALSLMGPADLAVLLLGTGLTAYALYRIGTCEANQ